MASCSPRNSGSCSICTTIRTIRSARSLPTAGISRQGVHDTLARAEELLEGYERTLGCIARDARLQKQLEVIAQNAQALARIPAAAPQAGAILRAVQEIKE